MLLQCHEPFSVFNFSAEFQTSETLALCNYCTINTLSPQVGKCEFECAQKARLARPGGGVGGGGWVQSRGGDGKGKGVGHFTHERGSDSGTRGGAGRILYLQVP